MRYASEGLLKLEAPDTQDRGQAIASSGIDILLSSGLLQTVAVDPAIALSPGLIPRMRWPSPVTELLQKIRGLAAPTAEDHEAEALAYLAANMKMAREDRSPVVSIRFIAATPQVAAQVVNRLMAAYIAANITARQEARLASGAMFTRRAAELESQVDAADQRLYAFRSQHNVLALQAGSVSAIELSRQQQALAAAVADRERLTAALATARGSAGNSVNGAAVQEALASPVIQMLRAREADTLKRIAQSDALGSQHPTRVALDDELRGVRAQIANETLKVVSSLSRDIEIAQQRVTALQKDVDTLQAGASASAIDQAILAQLSRDADAKRALYQGFLSSADAADITSLQRSPGQVVFAAVAAFKPQPSRTLMLVAFGVGLGALFGSAICIMRHLLSGKVTSAARLSTATGMPALASLPALRSHRRKTMARLAIEQRQSPIAETLRGIRITLIGRIEWRAGVCLLVTSAAIGEGKTSIAAAFARRAAADGARVLLIDADLHRSRLAQTLGMTISTSLEAVLTSDDPFDAAVQKDLPSGLHCLLSDSSHLNPTSLLASPRFAALLAYGRASYDLVVIDSPPVLHVSDAVLIASWSDIVLFAVQSERTQQAVVLEALRRFPESCQARIATVVNRARTSAADPVGYYGGYQPR